MSLAMRKLLARGGSNATAIQPAGHPSTPIAGMTRGSETDGLEGLRCGVYHRARAAMHFEHGEAALHQPVWAQAENSIDPGEAVGVGQRRLRKGRTRRRTRQHGR